MSDWTPPRASWRNWLSTSQTQRWSPGHCLEDSDHLSRLLVTAHFSMAPPHSWRCPNCDLKPHSSASCLVTQGRGPGLAPRPGTAAASGFHLWVTLPAPWLLQSFIHPPSKIPKRFPLPRRTPKEEPHGLGRAEITWERETAVVTPSGLETERGQEGVSLCTCHL